MFLLLNADHCPDACFRWEVAAEWDFKDGLYDGWELGLMLTVNGQETSAKGFVVASYSSVPTPSYNIETATRQVSAVRSPSATFAAERSQGSISFWCYSHGQFPATNNLGVVVIWTPSCTTWKRRSIETTLFIEVIPGRWNYVHQTAIIPKGDHYAVVFTTQMHECGLCRWNLEFEGTFAARDFVIRLDAFHLAEIGPVLTLRARTVLRFYVYATAAAGDGIYVNLNFADGEQVTISRQILGSATFNRWAQHSVLNETRNREFSLALYCGANNCIICGLDEIQLENEADLEILPFPGSGSTPGGTLPTSQPLPSEPLPAVTCDFEDGYCKGWLNIGDILWEHTNDSAPLISAGAYQGSGFVYSTLSFGGREYAAKLRTEEINALTDELTYGKVTFWVNHANAVSHYRFSVHAISSVLEHDEIAFADPATDTNRWIQQEAYFCLNGPGHLVFRAEHSDVLTSIGLDDIVGELYREPVGNPVCPMPTAEPVTTKASTRFPLVTSSRTVTATAGRRCRAPPALSTQAFATAGDPWASTYPSSSETAPWRPAPEFPTTNHLRVAR
ncbi:uncharacterized protein LOC129595211 [Paramacrobiotus metropolitanus]|uniref:uncharacterized protein LOC129595211 n=1 Tax=Paramacrobiotus metropolitanus TaxID=2943436 RepID=UPI002445DEDE|nr:uncharacterized protein LOC129595211 [Paramacrobiotus metropolitanus]